ncbi:hypothetical protein SAMN05428948_1049 [Massilia sp. CF038]|nr:hypothetical protein SAMN05428948_1049 [Massilia sp. CF038]
MPGLFRVSVDRGNAVVQGTNSGKSDEDVWVETWILGITSQSENTLRVAYSRVVNNVTSPSSDEDKTFAYGLSGTFTRRTAEILAADEISPIVEITAEESGNFNWRGKSMSAEGLKAALIAESKLHPITEVRLLEGDAYPDVKQLIAYGGAVRAIGLKKSFFERDGEFKTIEWVD